MAKLLGGKAVAENLQKKGAALVKKLKKQGRKPCLAIVRVGKRTDDLFYQGGLEKTCAKMAIDCRIFPLEESAGQAALIKKLKELSEDKNIHGILLFCPLPEGYDEKAAREAISPHKDVDCLTMANAAAVFTGDEDAFAPCTAEAVVELLKYYQIPLAGKRVIIIGRSQVVGKPLAMLLLKENATVTICHSKSSNLSGICREADILVAAVGRAKMIDQHYITPRQILVDVGINSDPDREGKICGDINFDDVEQLVEGITPVPGGIGSITSAMLCYHTLLACEKACMGGK